MTDKVVAIIVVAIGIFVFGKFFIYDMYKAIKSGLTGEFKGKK